MKKVIVDLLVSVRLLASVHAYRLESFLLTLRLFGVDFTFAKLVESAIKQMATVCIPVSECSLHLFML